MGFAANKFVRAHDATIGTGSQSDTVIISTLEGASSGGFIGTKPINVHGLRGQLRVLISGTGGPNFGYWGVIVKTRASTADPTLTTSAINLQADAVAYWAMGSWAIGPVIGVDESAGPMVDTIEFDLKTSRNIPAEATIELIVANSALSTATVRIHGITQCFYKVL